jgi:hypothetical protein
MWAVFALPTVPWATGNGAERFHKWVFLAKYLPRFLSRLGLP